MKRKLLIALFAFGTVAGFGSGIASMACWHHRAHERRAAFERHVAAVCVEAAQNARADDRAYDRPPPPPAAGYYDRALHHRPRYGR
jgi:hypothetical protein